MYNIRSFEIQSDIFDQILFDYSSRIVYKDDVNPYIHGYCNKQDIYYDGREYLICLEYILNHYCHNIKDCTDWKQCRLRRVDNINSTTRETICGNVAWDKMMTLLHFCYTTEEIEDIFKSYECEYSEEYKQYHYQYPLEIGELKSIPNCYKYDINGAHTDALAEMFPKAKLLIIDLYNRRHQEPVNKDIVNYFVGMLVSKGHRKTYNWIVQRTTKSLYKAMDMLGGHMIYVNTDGCVIAAPKALITASKELGQFKLEYNGTVFIYKDKNYWLMQCGNDMKGSCLTSVRKDIDLSQGIIVHYDRVRKQIGTKENGNPIYINIAENIIKEKREWQKEELW